MMTVPIEVCNSRTRRFRQRLSRIGQDVEHRHHHADRPGGNNGKEHGAYGPEEMQKELAYVTTPAQFRDTFGGDMGEILFAEQERLRQIAISQMK